MSDAHAQGELTSVLESTWTSVPFFLTLWTCQNRSVEGPGASCFSVDGAWASLPQGQCPWALGV